MTEMKKYFSLEDLKEFVMGLAHVSVRRLILVKIAVFWIASTIAVSMDTAASNFRSPGVCVKMDTQESIVNIWNASITVHIQMEFVTQKLGGAIAIHCIHLTTETRSGISGKEKIAAICQLGLDRGG
mmetsp:Transcript_8045/g.17372  ORF Transcript_8045/g.17372 Transcript_8045/m.17372 type:complete len:127 (-) Transcript_8045:2247-2627(-)